MCDRCNGMTEEQWLLGLLDKIDRFGWTVVGVEAGPDDRTGRLQPPFGYTVGLSALGLPELAVYGLDLRVAQSVLDDTAHLLRGGLSLEDGVGIGRSLDEPLVPIEMTDLTDLAMVRQIYGEVGQAFQLVWPDDRGRLPWDDNYSLTGRAQLLRGRAPV